MILIDDSGGYQSGSGGGGGGGASGGTSGGTSGGASGTSAPPAPTPAPVGGPGSNIGPLLGPDTSTSGGASLADVLLQTMRGRERMKGGQYAVMQGSEASGGGALVWVVLALIGAGVWYWYKSHGA